MNQFGFVEPSVLLLLLGLPLLYLLLRRFEALRLQRIQAISGQAAQIRKRALYGPLALAAIAIIALARPYKGYTEVKVRSVGRDIVFVFDVSLSMLTNDIPPSRIEAARHKVQDITNWVAKNAPGDRIGIVLFAGESYIFCPLTSDYDVVNLFSQSINTDLISSGGSALVHALETTVASFKETGAIKPLVILISDGEDDEFTASAAGKILATSGATLLTLGAGTPEGKPITKADGKFVRKGNGDIVISKLNEESLRSIAAAGHGEYRRMTLNDADFLEFLGRDVNTTENLRRNGVERSLRVYHDWGPALAFGILVVAGVLALKRSHWLVISLLLCTPIAEAYAETPLPEPTAPSLFDAYRAYQSGDYGAAKRGFEAALKSSPNDYDVLQSLGSVHFKLGEFDLAEQKFKQLDQESSVPRQQFEARYNLGNSELAAKKYKEAIESYDRALTIKPGDEKALFNKELAAKLLEEQKQNKPTPSPTPSPTATSANEATPTPSPSPEETSNGETPSPTPTAGASETSSPTAQPTPAQSGSPTPNDGQNGDGDTPTPAPSSEAQQTPGGSPTTSGEVDKDSSGTPTISPQGTPGAPSAQGTATAGAEATSNAAATQQAESAAQSPSETAATETPLSMSEAQRWLNSLPDAPVLLQRYQSRDNNDREQQW